MNNNQDPGSERFRDREKKERDHQKQLPGEDELEDDKEAELDEEEFEDKKIEAALAGDEEQAEVEDEFDGDEFEQEEFDEEAFQEAVAAQTGLDVSEYEDVEDLGDEMAEAKSVSKTKGPKRRRVPKRDDAKHSPRRSENKDGKRVIVHRSHSD